MKRPLLFLFALTSLFICFLYPHAYEPDPIFPQGQYYSVTVTGQLQTYHHQANGWSLLLTECLIRHKEQSYHCSRLLVTTEESTVPLQAGNQLSVEGSLSSFSPARNPGNFDWYGYYKSQRISYRVYAKNVSVTASTIIPLRQSLLTLRESLTLRLQQLCGPDTKTAALLTALLLGDKTLLEEDTKKQYQDGGILHILTVSGLHVSLLGGTVILLTKKMYLPPWLRGLTAFLLVLLYWQLCGGGISAGRAVVMFLCLTAAPLLGRTYDSLSALSLAGILLLCHSPSLLFQANFQLSFGAVLGIHLVCPSLTTDSSSVSKKASPILFSLGLQLTLLPITLYHFFRYPLYSLLLNLLVLPLITPLFLLGAAGLWLTALFPALSSVAATWFLIPCRWILQIYDLLCQASLALPHASALIGRPTLLRISLYYCVLGLVCLRKQRTAPLALIALLAILLLPLPHRSLSVTFLDVGQGDCAFLETPKGTTILIDSGSSDLDRMAEERLIPFLESQGVDHLDYVFLSHTDEDHFNGIVQWLDLGGSIGTAILPALPDSLVSSPSYQHAITLLTSYQVPILYFSQGMSWQEEELTLTCLAPVSPSHPHSSLYQDLNTASQVLLLQYQEIHILFTGDCEKEGENLLLDYLQEQNLTCHILKAGHHGSNFATSQALLTQLHPQAVIVSCGVRNRYGHPHPTMLSRTEDSGATCYVTASGGAVSVTISHGKARLKTFLSPGPLYYR
ncbi:MAG: DNA internalization-related competence protein ComEC/Rec2 [Lachnospiraceae bacterium]|nr:DNA internalization-related competence protein ComEC/Rec2 [Lachnospiraceae bacterium]